MAPNQNLPRGRKANTMGEKTYSKKNDDQPHYGRSKTPGKAPSTRKSPGQMAKTRSIKRKK